MYRNLLCVLARGITCVELDFNFSHLTRREDFGKVHSRASSAGDDGFDLKLGIAVILYDESPEYILGFWLQTEIKFFNRYGQYRSPVT